MGDVSDWRKISRALSEQAYANPDTDTHALLRADLEKRHGPVWDDESLVMEFEVEAFFQDTVIVIRRGDGRRGTLHYQHFPRYYFGFTPA